MLLVLLFASSLMLQPSPDERLLEAASSGDLGGVEEAIAAGASVNALGEHGETPLSEAVFGGHVEIVQRLLDSGAEPDVPRPGQATALMNVGHDPQICEMLIANGAEVDARDDRGRTPLLVVAETSSLKVIECLLGAGANVKARDMDGESPLYRAARGNSIEVVNALLAAGADVDEASRGGWTPLMAAASSDQEGVVERLLEAGARADARTEDGYTALEAAAGRWPDALHTVRLLLDAGATLGQPPSNDVLFRAVLAGEPELVRMFLRAGADPNATRKLHDIDGEEDIQPLVVLAALTGDETNDVLRALIDAGADVNASTKLEGDRPLDIAAEYGDSERVRLFLRAGAEVDARDKKGQTALMAAALYRPRWIVGNPEKDDFTEVMKLLLDAGADANARGNEGETPLLTAVGGGNLRHVGLLLQNGADPTARLKTGESIFELAERFSDEPIVATIRRALEER